ncbi:ribokinase [Periweissella fabalis]|uniref:Ribokinase n=1 Tax=Periweissella fabalis TaxID=1070421 RepID=A0A7X6N3P7_9LACO|nr:ribokinase [Periweissella fabalis]MCM0598526.1 ribokinase [Periweissella fabalis]NKZ24192.1 ribokinase [Periweissella fabalis]
MTRKVTVLGSLNADTIMHIERLPKQGETMAMYDATTAPGGKGANQAIAAARMEAKTTFVGAIGDDQNGQMLLDAMIHDNVDITNIKKRDNIGTGSAFIMLEKDGSNTILIHGGANQSLSIEDVKSATDAIINCDILVAQFETPLAVTLKAFEIAKQNGVFTILNPAPAKTNIQPELLHLTDLIVPNETEAETISGIPVTDEASMVANALKFRQLGVPNLIITVGARGAYYSTVNGAGFVPAFKVKAIDTTAAGDTFIGTLASQLELDLSNIVDAVRFSNRASSITVQGAGALPSIPKLTQVKAAFGE